MRDAQYRKKNDRSCCSSTYHKKDGTNMRAYLKRQGEEEVNESLLDEVHGDIIKFYNGGK